MSEKIQCNLVGNALDYLLLAGEMAGEDTPRMLKHAVATLADGVELLVKARLEVHDWSLLFKNVDDADRTAIESGEFVSVTFEQAIKRLKGICGVEIEKDHRVTLDALRKLRHKIRHFAVEAEKTEVMSLITKAYSFAVDFVGDHLEHDLDEPATHDLNKLRTLLGDFSAFVSERIKAIQPTLDAQKYAVHMDCPRCLQETLYVDGGEVSCAFCGYNASSEEAVDDWIEQNYGHVSQKDMMTDPVVEPCPECMAEACVRLEDRRGHQCLFCGEIGEYTHCSRCGELFTEVEGGISTCPDCIRAMVRKDD